MAGISQASPDWPLGVFDSGVGGLTVLRELRRLLPAESVLYLADTANVPYGDKPVSVVRDLALKLTEYLVQTPCKLIIMASGTSTVAGLDAAQQRYPHVPLVGTILPGARAALAATDGPIGVLATNATAQSRAFTGAVQRLAPKRIVVEQGCPRFVPLVESGHAETDDADDAACEYLRPLAEANVEAVILGCTHFPFLLPALHKACRRFAIRPVFVDPSEEAARDALGLLDAANLRALSSAVSSVRFAATGDPAEFAFYGSRLLGEPLSSVAKLTL
ncbi:MAG: glutamate racemase [Armatimonadota bacterium]|nr:glutamate racemase [Armatimonadota bacterium]